MTNATGILTKSSRCERNASNGDNRVRELEVEVCYESLLLLQLESMDDCDQHMCAYAALCVEEKFIQNKHKCYYCVDVLAADDKADDDLLAMKSIGQPSTSTIKLIVFANAVINIYASENHQANNHNIIITTIQNSVDIGDIFKNFGTLHKKEEEEEDEESIMHHKSKFISKIIKLYITMTSKKIARKITELER